MIIFGWRTIVTKLGIVFKRLCDHCHNEEYWILNRVTKWFTLFFIPVIPYDSNYFFSCPICKYGFNLNTDQIKAFKPIAEINQLLMEGKINQDQYQVKLNEINGAVQNPLQSNKSDEAESSIKPELQYCANCGTLVAKEIKFCGNCGVNVIPN